MANEIKSETQKVFKIISVLLNLAIYIKFENSARIYAVS